MKNVAVCILIGITALFFHSAYGVEQDEMYKAELQKCIGGKVNLKKDTTPIKFIEVIKQEGGETVAYLFSSKELGISTKGYQGMVEVILVCDPKGRVLSIFVGENRETPASLKKFQNGFKTEKWKNKKLGEAECETVTGATFTSNAVKQGLKNIIRKLDDSGFFKKLKTEKND